MPNDRPRRPASDRTAFQRVYDHYHHRLLSSITGRVRDRDRAEDIAAAAFQTAWEKRTQFRGESSLGTWLYAIALNGARNSRRQERAGRQDPMDVLETARYAEPDRLSERLEQDELRARVWNALHRIPARWRQLLVDRYINGLSVQEIAQRERVPVGTVGSRIFTATRLLREAWHTPMPVGGEMREEKVQQITEQALRRLGSELEAGQSEALKQYLSAMGRFRHYSWTNQFLIAAQKPTATRVAGYHTWRDLGRFVRKGEKGIMIVAPVLTKQPTPESEVALREKGFTEVVRPVAFRAAYVFDVEQTEGRALPDFATTTGDPKEYCDKLKTIVADRGIALEYDASIAPAQGLSSGGRIRLLPGLTPAEEFSTLAHELAHEILHHGPDAARPDKTTRETQAEAVAYAVCSAVGLETNSAAADYITLYRGDTKTLENSLRMIQDATHRILSDLLPEERLGAGSHSRSPREDRANGPHRDEGGSHPEATRPVDSPSERADSMTLDR